MTIRRGEIYLASLPGQSKSRPAVILTADWLSQYALDVCVVPLTSVARSGFPTRVELPAGEGGLKMKSWAKCDQVTTIPKSLLGRKAFGRLGASKMRAVQEAVRLALAL